MATSRGRGSVRPAMLSSSRVVAGLMALALVALPSCGPGEDRGAATPPAPPTQATPPAPPAQAAPRPLGVNGAVPARLRWRGCGGSFQCAAAPVPLDYNQPRGRTITLSVIRWPAADPAHRIGPLFVNFGGPGTGGVGELESLAPRYLNLLHERFDLISFDPRGVGGSAPVRCTRDGGADGGTARDKPPASPARPDQRSAFYAGRAALGHRCAEGSGALLAHTSTANTARDLELLRAAVGADSVNFLGYSYGTYVGATYANLFPEHTRAMVFDGVLDLVANSTGRPGQQDLPVDVRADTARAQAQELDAFFDRCTQAGPRCAFSSPDPHRAFADLMAKLKQRGNGASLAGVLGTVSHGLHSSSRWSAMAASLRAVYDSLRPGGAAAHGQPPTLDPYIPGNSGPFLATQCVDSDYPRDPQAYHRLIPVEDQRNPYFGLSSLFDMAQCIAWPASDRDRYLGPWNRPRQHPILLVNNRYDPETPVWNAEATRDELGHAGLLIVEGYGHTTLDVRSACATAAVARYFVTPQLPARGASCPADQQPFPPAR